MNDPNNYRFPVVFSIGIHLFVVLVFSLSHLIADNKVLVKPKELSYVKTMVVNNKALANKVEQAKKTQQQKKKDEDRIKEVRRKQQQKKAEEKKRIAAKKAKDKKALEEKKRLEKAEAERLKKLEDEKLAIEKQRVEREAYQNRLREQRRLEALKQEQANKDAQKLALEKQAQEKARQKALLEAQQAQDGEAISEYEGLIQGKMEAAWQRPLSAKNGMKVTLQINLIPGGEVVNVKVLESSGDELFDRSAVQAVWKGSPLPVPTDSGTFTRNYRVFNLLFQPEDLWQ